VKFMWKASVLGLTLSTPPAVVLALVLGSLPLVLPVSAHTTREPVYKLAGGPGCETPEAVKTLYLELDTLPGTTPMAIIAKIIMDRHAHGLLCAMDDLEPLSDAGSVGEFIRPSDGATMLIIKFLRMNGPPTYSWQQAPGTSM
jgi:hypothetical protein